MWFPNRQQILFAGIIQQIISSSIGYFLFFLLDIPLWCPYFFQLYPFPPPPLLPPKNKSAIHQWTIPKVFFSSSYFQIFSLFFSVETYHLTPLIYHFFQLEQSKMRRASNVIILVSITIILFIFIFCICFIVHICNFPFI